MSATTGMVPDADPATEDAIRRLARAALRLAVRGRRRAGGPWGEAVLAELDHTSGRWEAVRWSAGGIRAALRERRAHRRELPRAVRIRRRAAAILAVGVLAAAGVQHWVATPQYQPSASMEPSLRSADYWLMDRISFRITGLDYGDVVAYTLAGDTTVTQVRRVIGLPGDTIGCLHGRVLRNGTAIAESYLAAGTATSATNCPAVTVPAGAAYLLGDNRGVAKSENPVKLDRIEGRLLTRLWNTGPDGSWWAPPASAVP